MGEEKTYIGCKIIRAIPMTSLDFANLENRPTEATNRDGYKVTYPDGYVSWSPKEVFEAAYRLVSGGETGLILDSFAKTVFGSGEAVNKTPDPNVGEPCSPKSEG